MANVYIYVVDRDFGFAPNPFHGFCTLATCKPRIRKSAQVADWVIGVGGARLKATGRIVFAMKVTRTKSFDAYWSDPSYLDKRPVRNGSQTMMVGDNIYRWNTASKTWSQADSHHSHPDGSPNIDNVANDTIVDRVLLSEHFFYFGRGAPSVPANLFTAIGFRNGRNHRSYRENECKELLNWISHTFRASLNLVMADPFDFASSHKRYSVAGNRIR